MRRLAQSTAYTVMLKLFLSSDHVTAATGKTVAITISKAGGAFGNPNAGASNATEVSNGWYKFALDTTDTGSLGDLVVRGASASCDDAEQVCQVISATTGGATNLDAAVSAVKTKTDSLTFTVTNQVDSNVVDWKGATAPAMTGDAYARLGAPAGASTAADVAAIKAVLPSALVGGRMDSSIGAVASGVIAAASFASGALDAVWSTATRLLTAGTNIVLAKGTGVTGFNDLDASGVRAAVGLASANLDTQIATLATPTNITAGTITTVTNLTNAPTAGDLTATMKASVTTAATAATPTVSVTGTVNADIKKVNGVTVNGNGAGTPWGP